MRVAISFALVFSIVASATSAAAQEFIRTDNPIARSLAIEAARLASTQAFDDQDARGWARVEAIKGGDEIEIQRQVATRLVGRFVEADGTSLLVTDGAGPHRVARSDIYAVRMVKGRGSRVAAAIGVAGGALMGFWLASGVDWHECGCGMGPATLAVAPIGAAVGLGFAGYHAFRHPPEVIYRAPARD